jgi:hypothetical protein
MRHLQTFGRGVETPLPLGLRSQPRPASHTGEHPAVLGFTPATVDRGRRSRASLFERLTDCGEEKLDRSRANRTRPWRVGVRLGMCLAHWRRARRCRSRTGRARRSSSASSPGKPGVGGERVLSVTRARTGEADEIGAPREEDRTRDRALPERRQPHERPRHLRMARPTSARPFNTRSRPAVAVHAVPWSVSPLSDTRVPTGARGGA